MENPDHPWRILIVIGYRSGKTNKVLSLISLQLKVGTIVLYAKDPYKPNYQYLIKNREGIGLKHFKDLKLFIKYSSDMNDTKKVIQKRIRYSIFNMSKWHHLLGEMHEWHYYIKCCTGRANVINSNLHEIVLQRYCRK